MKRLSFFEHTIAYVTLGLLCGWYYLLLFVLPILFYSSVVYRSVLAIATLATLIILSIIPLSHDPWPFFMNCWLFRVWCAYFDVTSDAASAKLQKDQKYMFFEFPHGIFPMGQFLSASLIEEIFPGHMICGTGADVIFKIPVMRHLMAWLGTMPAKRQNISKILNRGHHCAVIPGGIAEMYLVNDKTEEIYLKSRRKTVQVAIEEGAHIVPIFFFGNSRIFRVAGQAGTDSFLARISRKLRASVVIFYGRQYLPVPFRQPIHIVAADIVEVKQNRNPTAEDIDDVMNRLTQSLQKMYETKKPSWEDRPLVIK